MKTIIKKSISLLLSWLIALGLFFCLMTFCILIWVGILNYKAKPEIPDNAALVLSLHHDIVEEPLAYTNFSSLLIKTAKRLNIYEVIQAIDTAAEDPRISSLLLLGNTPDIKGTPYATLKEVRDAIVRFKSTGKPVIAYIAEPSRRYYYLVSAANEIYMHPLIELPLNGLASEMMFLGNALQKYGIGVQTPRAGKYKSAIETFTRSDMSSENKEQTMELIDHAWKFFLAEIAQSRSLRTSDLQEAAQTSGLISAQSAQEIGLIDTIAHYDAILERMEKITGENEEEAFNQINIAEYIYEVQQNIHKKEALSSEKIAIVYANGTIVDNSNVKGQVSGNKLAKEIRKLRKDDEVKGVILRVNSPGGSALASDKIEREIYLTQQTKPVVVSMGPIAASGGYWIAARADHIFCQPITITGSIGVFSLWFNIGQIGNDHGITWDTIATNPLADIFSISRNKTAEEMAVLQKMTDQTYDIFLQKVSEGRNMTLTQIKEHAEGRVWSGQAAIQNGLVDETGGLQEAIAFLVKAAQLNKNYGVLQVSDKDNWDGIMDFILDDEMSKIKILGPHFKKLQQALTSAAAINTFDDPQGAYAYMPMNIEIE